MVLCLFALPIFAILGIFSATYRQLAKEAFICVFKKVSLQPCNTGLDTRIKTTIVGNVFSLSPRVGKFIHKHFTLLSLIFVVLSVATVLAVAWGGYNFYLYGNCNGPNSTGFCIFDPANANGQTSSASTISTLGECATGGHSTSSLQFNWFNPQLHAILNGSTNRELWLVGCFSCKYTHEAWPIIRQLQKESNFTLVFAHLPLHEADKYVSKVGYCIRKSATPEKFWQFADMMFAAPLNSSQNESFVLDAAQELGFSREEIVACSNSDETKLAVFDEIQNIATIGVYGTPTVYANGEAAVGPKPRRVYARMVG